MIQLVRIIEPETTEQETAGIQATESQQTTEQEAEQRIAKQEVLVNEAQIALMEAREKLIHMYDQHPFCGQGWEFGEHEE